MSQLARKTLKDLCEFIIDCEHKTAPIQETGYPSIRTPNIGKGRLILDDVNRVSEEIYEQWTRRATPRSGDLILAREAPAGNVAMVPESVRVCLGQRTVLIRPNSNLVDPRYLLYCLLDDTLQAKLLSFGSGATVPHVNMSDIRALEMPELPPRATQEKIGAILHAYDDLIENNLRRIRILEDMARALHREWFVEFRFPGHQKLKLIDSALGKIPERWELQKVTDTVFVKPRSAIPKEIEKPHVPMDSLATNSMLIGKVNIRTGNNGSKFKNGDTLFARITPCLENGKTAFVQFLPSESDVAIGSTEFIVLRSKTLCPEYVYLMARSNEFRDNAIKSMSGATGRQRVQEECFEKFMIAQPDEETLSRFVDIVRPMFRQVHNLAQRNETLRRTRDLLLPKLISGEVSTAVTEISV